MSVRLSVARLVRAGLAGGATLALALGGCGGGGDDDDGDRDAPTKQAYVAQVDRICADLDRMSGELARLDTEEPDDLSRLGRRVVGFLTGGVERIEAVPLPADARARREARAYVAELKRADAPAREFSAGVLALADALRARDKTAERAAVRRIRDATKRLSEIEATTDAQAQRFGFQRCGRGLGGARGEGESGSTAPSTRTG